MMLVNPALTTLAMAVYVAIDFTSAARQEEALLSERLPEYAGYMQRTGRFIPRWRH
jgi:protein-S-isoprenylcysteine O-methyltransferase Ste14